MCVSLPDSCPQRQQISGDSQKQQKKLSKPKLSAGCIQALLLQAKAGVPGCGNLFFFFFFYPVLAVTIRCTPPRRSLTLTMRPSTAMPRYLSHRMSSSPRQSCGTLLRSVGVRTCRNTPQNPLYFDKFAQNLVYSTTKAQPRVGQRRRL